MSYSGNVRLIGSTRIDATGLLFQNGVFILSVGGVGTLTVDLAIELQVGDTLHVTNDQRFGVPRVQINSVERVTATQIIIHMTGAAGEPVSNAVSLNWYRQFKG